MDRRSLLGVVAGVSILSAAIGWFAGQSIQSPAEVAAQTAAPDASLITVPVELREIASRVVVRGTVTSSEVTRISVSGTAGGSSIITRLPKDAGDEIVEGDVVVEVAGRPLFVLQGELPVFRSLGPSMEGPDVRQLEQSLIQLGYTVGTLDGVYDSALAGAVEALYRDAGYKANVPSVEEEAALTQARSRVRSAENALAEATGGSQAVPESQRLQLQQAVNAQQELVNQVTAQRDALLAEPKTAADQAKELLDAVLASPDATDADRTEAQQRYDDADYVYWVTKVEQDKIVAAASLDLAIAKASQREAGSQQGGNGSLIESYREELAASRADLARTLSTTGVSFPASELVFVSTLPRAIQSVDTEVGSFPSGPVLTTTGTSTVIESAVSAADRRLLEEGLEVVVEDDDLGISQAATISFLAATPGTGGVAEAKYEMKLTPSEDLPDDAFNQSLRVTIPISTTGGEVLAVPLAAVSAAADGGARVEVERSGGQTELVDVTTGLSADGFVAVTAITGELAEGDRVVVGLDLATSATGSDDDAEAEDG